MTFIPNIYGILSNNNSVNDLQLGSSEILTCTSDDISKYNSIKITIDTDYPSSSNGLEVQFSTDNAIFKTFKKYTIVGSNDISYIGEPYIIILDTVQKYFRIKYTNGTTIAALTISTLYNTSSNMTSNIQNNSPEYPNNTMSLFDEYRVSERTPLITLKTNYGLSLLRDKIISTNGATVTNAPNNGTGEYTISSPSNSTISFLSAEKGNYQSGYSSEAGIAVRMPDNQTLTAGQDIYWGLGNLTNGIFYGIDDISLYIAIIRNNVVTKIRQSDWNIDPLNGSGKSGINLNILDGIIYQINFSWYGFGIIQFDIGQINTGFVFPKTFNKITVHKFKPTNQTSVVDPNFPITLGIINSGNTTLNAYVAGRQFSIIGKVIRPVRITTEIRSLNNSVANTAYILSSFRRKPDYSSIYLRVNDYQISTDNIGYIEIYFGSTLSPEPVWNNPSGSTVSETGLQSCINTTSISGGVLVYRGLTTGVRGLSSLVSNALTELSIPTFSEGLSNVADVSLVFKPIVTNTDLYSVFSILEEW